MRRNDQSRYVSDTSFQIDNPTMLILHAYVLNFYFGILIFEFSVWNFHFGNIQTNSKFKSNKTVLLEFMDLVAVIFYLKNMKPFKLNSYPVCIIEVTRLVDRLL